MNGINIVDHGYIPPVNDDDDEGTGAKDAAWYLARLDEATIESCFEDEEGQFMDLTFNVPIPGETVTHVLTVKMVNGKFKWLEVINEDNIVAASYKGDKAMESMIRVLLDKKLTEIEQRETKPKTVQTEPEETKPEQIEPKEKVTVQRRLVNSAVAEFAIQRESGFLKLKFVLILLGCSKTQLLRKRKEWGLKWTKEPHPRYTVKSIESYLQTLT